MANSLGFGFGSTVSDTELQIGCGGEIGVTVGMMMFVGVAEVGTLVGRGVLVGGLVVVGVGVLVLEGVELGSTTAV